MTLKHIGDVHDNSDEELCERRVCLKAAGWEEDMNEVWYSLQPPACRQLILVIKAE